MNLKAALDVLVVSAEMDAKSLMSKTGEQTPASDALWTIASKLRRIAAAAEGNPAGTPGAKVDMSRLSPDLPPPFDSQEEAQRAAGIWPQEAEPATVRVKPSALDEMAARAASWAAAEKRIVGAHPGLGATYVGVAPIDFKNHQWIGIAIDHATKWKTVGGLQNLLMAKHYLDKLIELEGKAA